MLPLELHGGVMHCLLCLQQQQLVFCVRSCTLYMECSATYAMYAVHATKHIMLLLAFTSVPSTLQSR